MGVHKVFNSIDLTLFFTAFIFALFLTKEEKTTNITVHIVNYNRGFLLNNFWVFLFLKGYIKLIVSYIL